MPVVDPATFARWLSSSDDEGLAAFVADLWAARGWETAVQGATVVARKPPAGRRVVIRCVGARRWWLRPRAPVAPDADLLVTARPRGFAGRLGDEAARVVRPAALRDVLLYAVDRETATDLAVKHFDRPLEPDAPARTLADRLSVPPHRLRLAAGVAILAMLAVGLVLAAGPGGQLPGSQEAAVEPTQPATPPPAAGPRPTADPESGYEPPPAGGSLFRYPPGIGTSGITDVEELAAAHRAAVANTSWDLLIIHHGSDDLLHPDRQWIGSRQTVDRVNETRYRYRVTGLERTGPDTFESTVYDDYGDGNRNVRRVAGDPEAEYRRTRLPTVDGEGVFTAVGAGYVHRYLDTSESRVRAVEYGDGTRFRVVATGTPRRLPSAVDDYTAVALVDRRGLVHRLTVYYVRPDGPGPSTATPPPVGSAGLEPAADTGTVRFSLVYRDVGAATVSVPEWYDAAVNATNGSDIGDWPNDPAV